MFDCSLMCSDLHFCALNALIYSEGFVDNINEMSNI